MAAIHHNNYWIADNRAWLDIVRRQSVERLLMFLNRFDDRQRVQIIETETDINGYLTRIVMETITGERYVRLMDYVMMNRLEVFNRTTLYFNRPHFREDPEAEDLIDKALVLLETLFKVDRHLFDEGVNRIHIHHSHLPNLNLDVREAVQYVRHVYDWELYRDLNESVPQWPEIRGPNESAPSYSEFADRTQKNKDTDEAEVAAFVAKIDALLAEDDDTDLPQEDQLPKAMPTG